MSDVARSVLDSLDLILFLTLIAIGYVVGRRNERRHLDDLMQREQLLQEVLTFATRYPAVRPEAQDPRLVSGSVVIAADAFRMFVAGLRKLVGGRFRAYETLVDRARREAVLRMKEQAHAAGCPMIFNVRVETTQLMSGNRGGSAVVEVIAYGTAFAPAVGSVSDSLHRYTPGPSLPAVEGFDLMKNRVTKWVVALGAAATVYSFIELVAFGEYWYADSVPWPMFYLLAALCTVFAVGAMHRHKVPPAETVSLSLLIVVLLPPLLFFPALRLNALTDLAPPHESVYVLQEDGSLSSKTPGEPVLRFPQHAEYWREQAIGSQHRFVLRRGMLGFWQVAREPYVSALRVFEEKRWRERPAPASAERAGRR